MEQKEKKALAIKITAGIIISLMLVVMVYFIFFNKPEEVEVVNNLGPSDSMIPADPALVDVSGQVGQLIANPTSINFTQDQKTQIFSLLAIKSPISITGAEIDVEFSDQFTAQNIDCPIGAAALTDSQSCSISLTWIGTETASTTIEITANSITGDTPVPINLVVAINAVGGGEPIPADVPVDNIPQQNFSDNSVPVGVDEDQQLSGPALQEQRRIAYLNGRRQTQLSGFGPPQLAASAQNTYSSWSNIGVNGTTSSFPTDMSRVITPDKPITAVIAFPIDTRASVTAVAMVDRDVYGGNGRTVVIPRGSRLVGTVSGGLERVGVAWTQLIRPDGVRFVFDASSGDAQGRGGIPGKVNEQFLRRYGFSLLAPTVAAGLTVALGGNSTSQLDNGGVTQQRDARSVAAEILTQPLNTIANDIAQRNSQIPVQITVSAGTRITVWSVGDLRLKPVGEKDTVEQTENNRRSFTEGQNLELPDSQDNQNVQNNRNGIITQNNQNTQNNRNAQPEGSQNINSFNVGSVDANGNFVPAAPVPTRDNISQQRNSNQNPFRN